MVPEKQGLKLTFSLAFSPGANSLSSGSRKTRIETSYIQKQKQKQKQSLSSGSRKTRIETGHKFNGSRDFCVSK